MNRSFRRLLATLSLPVVLFTATGSAQNIQPANAETKLARLDALLGLSITQKTKAAEIFGKEFEALHALAAKDGTRSHVDSDRLVKTFETRQQARADVIALLTDSQRKKYETTPMTQGGGQTINPDNRVASLDAKVSLSAAQKALAAEIFQEEADALVALAPADRPAKGAEFRKAAREQINALLTPEQRNKIEKLRLAAAARETEERTCVETAVKTSAALAARFGTIERVNPSNSWTSESGTESRTGRYNCKIVGKNLSATITVFWERIPAGASVKVVKIQTSTGESILL